MTKEALLPSFKQSVDRRSFMKGGLLAGGAVMGASLLANAPLARAQSGDSLNPGDVAILQFLAAAEQTFGRSMRSWAVSATIRRSR
jgi:hypothetical protein